MCATAGLGVAKFLVQLGVFASVLYTLLALDIDPVEQLVKLLPISEVRGHCHQHQHYHWQEHHYTRRWGRLTIRCCLLLHAAVCATLPLQASHAENTA
jgi:hypothetical protein